MQLEEFKNKISREGLIDKITYYVISAFAICGGLYMLYDALNNTIKYNKYGTIGFALLSSAILILFGLRGFYLVPIRYKIIPIEYLLPINKKEEVISALINNIGNPYFKKDNSSFKINYRRKWYTADYTIYINSDENRFYLSIQSNTHATSGFADFGGTEKLRKKISGLIKNLAEDNFNG